MYLNNFRGETMLQFIFGRPASGKTYTVVEKIKNYAQNNSRCVFIVPEQFSFESERAILKALGDKTAQNVDVLSFTRLSDEVGRIVGGIAGRLLNECDKLVFIKQALNYVRDDLKLWRSYTDSVNFAKNILDAISELKLNAVMPKDLRNAAEKAEGSFLSEKLKDLALVYENYDAMLGEKFIDPIDSLTKLNLSLEKHAYFKDKHVFFDSFKGFTGQQFRIVEKIISQAENVYFSFTNDYENKREFNIYSNIRKVVQRIENSAKKYNVNISDPIILGEPRYNSNNLSAVEALISGKDITDTVKDDNVNIYACGTVSDEAEYVARTIKKLTRENNYRYRDIVIIARDEEIYREQIGFSCKKNNVNCFYDRKIPLSAFPMATAIEAAIGALSLTSEMILNFHKTGLGTLDTYEISRLENYIFLWNINGKQWNDVWDMNPNGLTDRELAPEENEKTLADINTLRIKALEPLLDFIQNFKGNSKQMASAIINLIKKSDFSQKLIKLSEKLRLYNNNFSADVLRLSFDEYIKILDSIVSCYKEREISRSEFCETLKLSVSLASVGVIPQTLDQVTFGAADRIRPSRPKIAFIVGANQGIFPKTIHNTGIFNISERKFLIEQGVEISDNSLSAAIDEEFLVYSNLCCPSEKLYISYAEQTVSGEGCEPSTFVSNIIEKLKLDVLHEPGDCFTKNNIPETLDSAVSEYSRRLKKNYNDAVTIKTAIKNTEGFNRINVIDGFYLKRDEKLSADTAKRLFGQKLYMSASKFDNYHRCPFSYFCRYGLKAQKLQPADFDVMQRGTIVHYVLERFVDEFKDKISDFDISQIDTLTESYISDYLNSIKGYRKIENSHSKFLVSRISRSLKEVVLHIAKELKQSDFKPIACEFKIGENSSLKFPFDSGEIILSGSIDRVDEYNGYIRIIDYKTGSKSFKLPDILFGLNMQMLIYLYAVTRAKGLPDSKAAGILYQPSKRDLNDNGMAMNGLLQSDIDLISAMDKSLNGEFVPKLSLNNDGTVSKRSNSFIEAERFAEIFDHIEKIMTKTGNEISSGNIAITPLDGRESPACTYCDYATVCGIENAEVARVPDLKLQEVFENMKGD